MKIARVQHQGVESWGLVHSDHLTIPGSNQAAIPLNPGPGRHGAEGEFPGRLLDACDHRLEFSEVQWLPPIRQPQKIICVGRNYADHAAEMGSSVEDLPVIFNKFPTAISGPDSQIVLPEHAESVDFEAELVVVIGRPGSRIPIEHAWQYVLGYCCGNDVSARDWQKGKPGGQWLLGKTFDGFAPIGPWVVTPDELDPQDQELRLYLNGQLMQQDRTANLIFKIDFLISHVSRFCTLCAGDLLFTGTPAGVGAGRRPPVFLQPGDETVVEISGIGSLKNTFVRDQNPAGS